MHDRGRYLKERAARGEDLDDEASLELCRFCLSEVPFMIPAGYLGSGSFGLVLHAVDTRSQPAQDVAVKMIPRGGLIRSYKTYLKREIVHTATLRHPSIIPIRDAILTPTHLGISSDLCSGGDLHKYVASRPECRLSEAEARWLFQQLAVGLSYCHTRGVANRDLKLENLLLDKADAGKPILRIADFGYSKHEMNSCAKTGVGTTAYMAPEIFMGALSYDAKAADWWSAGVVLFVLIAGRYPFDPLDAEFAKSVVAAQYYLPGDVTVSPECNDLLDQLLKPNPSDRANASRVMIHPWVLQDLPPGALELNQTLLGQAETHSQADCELAVRVDALVDLAASEGSQNDEIIYLAL